MKNFLKTLLAVICGLLIVNLIGFWIIASVASIGGKAPAIPTQGVLRVDMSKIIVAEQSTQSFNFSQKDNLSLIHISEPTRPRLSSYAVFCLKKKKI